MSQRWVSIYGKYSVSVTAVNFWTSVTSKEKRKQQPAGVNTKRLYTKYRSFTTDSKQNTEDKHLNNMLYRRSQR